MLALALGLILGQSAPYQLAPPATLAGPQGGTRIGDSFTPQLGLPPGTRLLPFNEAEPSRGPLAPPALGPPPLSPEEWHAIQVMRAKRQAPDSSMFKAGPKDPWRAVTLSAEGLLVGILFPPLITVGPSAGQAYSGQWTQAVVTSSIRTLALTAMATAAISFGSTLGNANSASQLSSAAATLDGVLIAGGVVIALASAFDIATAYQEAVRANEQWERSVLGEAP